METATVITSKTFIYLLLAVFFLLLNAFFVAAEFALVKIRATRVQVLASDGNKIAKLVLRMVDHMDGYLSATQLGITLASLGLGWIGEPAFAHIVEWLIAHLGMELSSTVIHSISFTISFSLISALHIILGELIPKSIAIQMAEKTFFFLAVPFQFFYIIFYPFLVVLNGVSNFILNLLPLPKAGIAAKFHSEAELKLILEDSYEGGAIEHGKRILLDKALDFTHKTVSEIMVPEKDIVYIEMDRGLDNNLEIAQESGYTRLPFKLSVDAPVSGYIHMKDTIWNIQHRDLISLYDLQRPILEFKSDLKLDLALKRFQNEKIHIAMVYDEENIIGLITIEDIIEEIVGEIDDEFDVED